MFALTEEGRIFDLTPKALLEYVDGNWVKPVASVSADAIWNSRQLSESDLSQLLESDILKEIISDRCSIWSIRFNTSEEQS